MPRRRRWRGDLALAAAIAALATVAMAAVGVAVGDGGAEFDYRKLSGIIIPGFASTQLRAWSVLDCPYSPFDFNPLDSVWLDTTKTDHPECKSRPDSGLSAITELDPGYITGPLSSVWKEWVKWCVEFGIEANAIIAVPYDWRLPPSMLEERDLYFHKLKLTFEIALKLRGGPSLVFAHSMGNNVFRYFLEWLKLEIAPKHYIQWLDKHIHAYFAVGAPLLGSTEAVRAVLSGATFGLPVNEGTARLMFNSFGSSLWLLPFSKHCRADNIYWKYFFEGKGGCTHRQQCDEMEYISDYSGWPTNLVSIEVPTVRDMEAYPSVMDITENLTSSMECGKPTLLSFSAREVSDGTLFKTIEDYDPQSKALVYQLEKYYQGDPVLNPLTPWERPPIKNVFCIYGIDSKTEVGYYFAPSGKPYPDNWIITDIIYEFDGSLLSRSGNSVSGKPNNSSGDGTVSYNSLSWCKNWLGPKLNITRAPQAEHDGSDLQTSMNIEHHHGQDIFPNMTRARHVKYITYYEDAESIPGWRTAVWELDKANHRNIVRMPVLMRELWLEMWHDMHPDSKSKFVTKAFRGPLRNEDCRWDYAKARCGFPEHCEYRYTFGDVHLGMSCRLKNTSTNLLQQYL
ncbi:phospholipid--sterol O-acyltransferase isoform X3 [Phragmites australis]|uniref:phospholipid--sterol O-acyltransferase isoform X3 n=1 Tax=Phragmites australis TaxID=29695 RepID=UPI002D79297A|nr:phospholipid--sterol O-acyltransferase isoform X3 [Phragmites australis]